eukprot:5660403-Amphidinium_carterae.1
MRRSALDTGQARSWPWAPGLCSLGKCYVTYVSNFPKRRPIALLVAFFPKSTPVGEPVEEKSKWVTVGQGALRLGLGCCLEQRNAAGTRQASGFLDCSDPIAKAWTWSPAFYLKESNEGRSQNNGKKCAFHAALGGVWAKTHKKHLKSLWPVWKGDNLEHIIHGANHGLLPRHL